MYVNAPEDADDDADDDDGEEEGDDGAAADVGAVPDGVTREAWYSYVPLDTLDHSCRVFVTSLWSELRTAGEVPTVSRKVTDRWASMSFAPPLVTSKATPSWPPGRIVSVKHSFDDPGLIFVWYPATVKELRMEHTRTT